MPGLIIAAFSLLVAAWYLGATAYLVFHDQLVASLISHQADVQYSYEDRIAALQTELDRQTSQALLDRQTLSTEVRNLTSRSALIEARAATIDGLIRSVLATPLTAEANKTGNSPAGDDLASTPLPGIGITPLTKTPAPAFPPAGLSGEDHADISTIHLGKRLTAVLDRVETRQATWIAQLREPLFRKIERLQTALLDTGLPLGNGKLWTKGDVGGPFIPLTKVSSDLGFDQNLSLLKAAVAEHARLSHVVDGVPLRRPVDGPLEVTSPFGARIDPFLGQAAMHTGVDLVGAYGAPVRATANGIVTLAGSEGGYGNMVEVDHGDGVATRYAHLSAIDVAVGQKISGGDVVGRAGSSGRATGPHLHYETRINGAPVDPRRFLKAGAGLFSS